MYSIQRGRGHLARNVTTLASQLRGPLKQLIGVVEVRDSGDMFGGGMATVGWAAVSAARARTGGTTRG